MAVAGALGLALEKLSAPKLDEFQQYLVDRKARLQLDKLSTFSPEKKEALIDAEVARVREFVRGPEGKRILENGTDDEVWMLITMLPPIIREHIAGTKYDVSPTAWPSVVIPDSGTAALDVVDLSRIKQMNPKSYGNGFYVDSKTLVTNLHVLGGRSIPAREAARLELAAQTNALDIVYATLPKGNVAVSKPLSMQDTNDSVHASFVTIAGIKPDSTAAADGTKLYPGIAIRMTPNLSRFLFGDPQASLRSLQRDAFLKNSFMVVLPPGETGSRDGRRSPSDGMSGSPVLKSGSLAGIFRSGINGRLQHRGLLYDIGFFHGPDEIKKAREVGLMYKVPGK